MGTYVQNWECTDADVEYKYTEIVDTKIIEHPAETETKTVVVKEAWTETVVIGQKCSGCDAEK